jgi:hypothetical protein
MTTPLGPRPQPLSPAAPGPAPLSTPPGDPQRILPGGRAGDQPPSDPVALLRAALEAGRFDRAEALLAFIKEPAHADPRVAYLRLWLLIGQDRVLEALEQARLLGRRWPDSAAIAYVHAVLERVSGDPEAALEVALRAAALRPGDPVPDALVEAMAEEPPVAGRWGFLRPGENPGPSRIPAGIPNPAAAAMIAAQFLWPSRGGDTFHHRAGLPPLPQLPEGELPPGARRLVWIAVATVAAALWAPRDPLLASAALAAVVAWFSRPRRG